MEPEGLLPSLQELSTCTYPEPSQYWDYYQEMMKSAEDVCIVNCIVCELVRALNLLVITSFKYAISPIL
jgi:hypothetical protein